LNYDIYAFYIDYIHYNFCHIVHTLVGGRGQHGGFDALDYRKIRHGNAGKLGTYDILSVLPDKFARFLFEFHAHRFESLDLPFLPADRSDFDVHGALLDDKVTAVLERSFRHWSCKNRPNTRAILHFSIVWCWGTPSTRVCSGFTAIRFRRKCSMEVIAWTPS